MRKSLRLTSYLFLILFSLILSSCARFSANGSRIFLRQWSYSLDGRSYTDLPDKPLGGMEKLIPGKKGFITLHTEFEIPWQMQSGDVGLALGKMLTASKVILNGKEVGFSGVFPPKAFAGGQAYTNILLPSQNLKINEPNILEVILWVEGAGGISDKPFVSSYEDTTRYTNRMTFIYSKLNMIFSWSMILTGIAYLLFYVQQRKDKHYRHYALMNLWTSLFLVPFWISEIPNAIGIVPFVWWNKILNGTVAVIVGYYATSFMRSFLGVETGKKISIARKIILVAGIIYTLLIPSQTFFHTHMLLLMVFIGLQLIFSFTAIYGESKKHNREVIKLLAGFSPVILTLFVDLFLKLILKLSMVPYMTVFGWQMTAITFIAIVTKRYAKIRNEFEYLNENLEKEVEDRTEKLTLANEELERRQAQADRDMELAVYVQKSFYPQNFDFLGWDVAVSFNPCSGVSGDLYDFYVLEGMLRGFGLFDVSGHGISSGLVTMLAKNAIFHSFLSTLPLTMNEAMKVVNKQVIQVKGEIENYLTGCLFRIEKETPNVVEFVNAGAPHPIYKSHNKKKKADFLLPDPSKPHYGMLGVPGLEVEFQSVKKKLKKGDTLVLYTDGITESENAEGEAFGKERMLEVLDEIPNSATAQEVADAYMSKLKSFIGDKPVNDDITILVLKKINESSEPDDLDEIGELESL